MAKKSTKKDDTAAARHARTQEAGAARAKADAPVREARKVRHESLQKEVKDRRQRMVDRFAEEDETDKKKSSEKVTLHDGKPGSGSGLKPGMLHAPKSNPGAAARVPNQPLQPESLQSHGLGILYDKDLDNPPYDAGDPETVDEGPSGSGSPSNAHAHARSVDKKAERQKAEKASGRFKQVDPDNPTVGAGGRKDATASPEPIGSRHGSKNAQSGGSNSGIDE